MGNENANGEEQSEEILELAHDEFSALDKSVKQLNRVLRNTRYRGRFFREEQGFNALYIGLGLLKWREGLMGEYYFAPLILLPVDVIKETSGERWGVKTYEYELIVNPTLQAKLSQDFKINLPSAGPIASLEDFQSYLSEIQELVRGLEGWEIIDSAVLGIFNFLTMMMINDINLNKDLMLANKLIGLLSGLVNSQEAENMDIPSAEELDEVVDPMDVFQILDADSSQQEAIEAAKRGLSFVLQGQPGTGKSQTIANIIAEGLADGKKILFASQKSVALDIVYNRLAQQGLGDYCLEIHSYKKKKTDVINELGKSLTHRIHQEKSNSARNKRGLAKARAELNDYARLIHRPMFSLAVSMFQATGLWSSESDKPNLKFLLPNVTTISSETLQSMQDMIIQLTGFFDVIASFESHAWKGLVKDITPLHEKEKAERSFENAVAEIKVLSKLLNRITKLLGIENVKTLENAKNVLDIFGVYEASIFSRENMQSVTRQFEEHTSAVKFFKSQYWKDRRNLSSLIVDKENLTKTDIEPITYRIYQVSQRSQCKH